MSLLTYKRIDKVETEAGEVHVKTMSALDRGKFFDVSKEGGGSYEGTYKTMFFLLSKTICDSEGSLLYSPEEIEGIDADILEKIYNKSAVLNGIKEDSLKNEVKN